MGKYVSGEQLRITNLQPRVDYLLEKNRFICPPNGYEVAAPWLDDFFPITNRY